MKTGTPKQDPKETELLLLLSRVNPETPVLDTANLLVAPGIDWDSFVVASVKSGTANLIYKNLLRLHNIPGDVLERFRNMYNNSVRNNILMVSEHDRIIDGLNDLSVDVISLKGPIASEEIFGDIGIYPSGDLDILVRIEDMGETCQYLESIGYCLVDQAFVAYRDYFIHERYHISFSNGRYVIEPHWNLFYRYFTTPPEFWWDESITISSGGRKYLSLSPEKNVLYNAFRLFSKVFSELRFLAMLAEIVHRYEKELDWGKLFLYAKEYKFENLLRLTMRLSRDLLGAPVPEDRAEIRGLVPHMLYKTARRMTLRGESDYPMNKIFLAFLRDDFVGALKVILRRLFPSQGEIVSRYRLPVDSRRAMVYYFLNPLLLLMNRHQERRS
jgi:hypothetical protein